MKLNGIYQIAFFLAILLLSRVVVAQAKNCDNVPLFHDLRARFSPYINNSLCFFLTNTSKEDNGCYDIKFVDNLNSTLFHYSCSDLHYYYIISCKLNLVSFQTGDEKGIEFWQQPIQEIRVLVSDLETGEFSDLTCWIVLPDK